MKPIIALIVFASLAGCGVNGAPTRPTAQMVAS